MSTGLDTEVPQVEQSGEESPGKEHHLGLLVVHGIGEQTRGGVVTPVADALHEHLRRLFTRDDEVERQRERLLEEAVTLGARRRTANRDDALRRITTAAAEAAPLLAGLDAGHRPVRLDGTCLVADPGDPAAPAHVMLVVDPRTDARAGSPYAEAGKPGDADAGVSRLCIAESWWAKEFEPPNAGASVWWTVRVAPAVVIAHGAAAAATARQQETGVLRWWLQAVAVLHLLAALALLGALVPPIVLLQVLSHLHLPKVSTVAKMAAVKVTASLGDSHVLLDSPVALDAMASRVDRDLRWLLARCDRVVVFAHSQGALVAHAALRRSCPRGVVMLVTFGAGVAKLTALRQQKMAGPRLRMAVHSVNAAIVAVPLVPLMIHLTTGWGWQSAVFGGLYAVLLLSVCCFSPVGQVAKTIAAAQCDRERQLLIKADCPGGATPQDCGVEHELPWRDFFASSDLVPGGPLLPREPRWLRSRLVWNQASPLRDHSGYISNPDGFLGPLLLALQPVLPDRLRARLEQRADLVAQFAARRGWRCGVLTLARWAVVGAASVAVWLGRDSWLAWTDALFSQVPQPLRDVTSTLTEGLPFLSVLDSSLVRGALVFAAALWLLLKVLHTAFRAWERHDVACFYAGARPDGASRSLFWFLGTALLLALLPLATVGGTVNLWTTAVVVGSALMAAWLAHNLLGLLVSTSRGRRLVPGAAGVPPPPLPRGRSQRNFDRSRRADGVALLPLFGLALLVNALAVPLLRDVGLAFIDVEPYSIWGTSLLLCYLLWPTALLSALL